MSKLGPTLVAVVLMLSLGAAAGAGARAHPSATRALTRAQSVYLSDAQSGVELAGRYWGNPRFHWYNGLLNDPKPYPLAAIWDAVPVFESLDEIAIASPTGSNKQAVVSFANRAENYWDPNLKPGPAYVPYYGGRGEHTKTFYDDNSVLGLAFMDAYRATGDTRYLSDAERAMHFVTTYAWDWVRGGMWWNTWHSACSQSGSCRQTTTHHSELLAVATDLAAELYQATGSTADLQTAEKYIIWANHHLLKWDGSYAARTPGEQIMPHDGEGALIAAFTTLCQTKATVPAAAYAGLPPNSFHSNPSDRRPSDPGSWCSWAESLAHKTAFGVRIGTRNFDRYMPLNEGPQWDDIYVRGLLTLYGEDHKAVWYRLADRTAARILKNAPDSNGLFMKAWNGSSHIPGAEPGMLRTHASSVSVLAALAAVPPPS
jgi:hypothetical protein